ncbi:MAG: class I SAM-dependent RNA methyltransferase [Ilumatobacteraceae bacterium]
MTDPHETPSTTTVGSHIDVMPERFVAGGEALGHGPDGRVVFVRGGLPGDAVSVEIVEQKGEWSRGVVTTVTRGAPERVEPPCLRRREGCGGCDWQHLAVDRQLPAKLEIVRDALRRTGRLDDPTLTLGATVDDRGYRTTIRVVGGRDGRAAFRQDRSHDTVSANGCIIAHPALLPVIDRIRITPELEVSLRVSAATGQMTARWDRRRGEVDGLPRSVYSGANAHLTERVAGHDLRVSAGAFFQSGPAAANLLVDAVRRAAPEVADARTVLDAYAGVGLFAVAVAPATAKVITVETSRAAVGDAQVNLAGRDARVEQCEMSTWRPERGLTIDVAIADPARSGLGRPGSAAVVAAGPQVLALVSCDPVALARDTELLGHSGYRHDGTEVLDLFPHTHHVECVTRFVRS